jgi:menaquinone-9 beta-reductase
MPHREPSLAFHHPVMQQALMEETAAAGAKVWRPSRLVSLMPGDPPAAEVKVDGVVRGVTGRLIGADGRDSQVARLGAFERLADPDELLAAGLLVQGKMDTGDAANMFRGQAAGQIASVIRIAPGLYRLYFFHHIDAIPSRFSGDRDVQAAFAYVRDAGVPGECVANAPGEGPLATFDGAHRRIERPYSNGVVLSAMRPERATRPGEAVSCAPLRDVRLLRDTLVSTTDWPRAADEYTGQHDDEHAPWAPAGWRRACHPLPPARQGLARKEGRVGAALGSGRTQGVHRRSGERGEFPHSLRIVVGEVRPAFLVRQLQQPVAAAFCAPY